MLSFVASSIESVSIADGAIKAPGWSKADYSTIAGMYFDALAKKHGFTMNVPYGDLPEEAKHEIMYGTGGVPLKLHRAGLLGKGAYEQPFEGLVNNLERRYKETTSDWARWEIEQYMVAKQCPDCRGARLKKEVLAVTVGGLNIFEFVSMPVTRELEFLNHLQFSDREMKIGDQILKLNCSFATKVRADLIPTGEIVPVEGTPLDFRKAKAIGKDIDSDDEQMKFAGGYDHNFVIDGYTGDGSLLAAGEVYDPATGRVMEVLTTVPGIQFYTANGMVAEGGKKGRTYGPRSAYALETQFFPDNVHHDNFPKAIFGPGRDYVQTTVYRFPACR